MTTQAERIAALETLVSAQAESINALATRLVEAHARIDHASVIFNRLRAATVSALTPRVEPITARLPRVEFDRALADLRADAEEAGAPQRFFTTGAIRERAERLRTLEENTRAAAA